MASQGMFGPSGAEVELALREQQKQEAMQYASMPAGRGPVALMAQAGQGIGRAIEGAAGYQDPRIAKAKLLEEAKMEVDSSGADLMSDPKGYYGAAFKALQSRGLTDEAMSVRQLLISEEASSADAEYKRSKARELDGKGRYVKLGAGGAYDTATGETIAPANSETEKPNSTIGKLKADFESGLISEEEYKAGLDKATYIRPSGNSDIAALAGAVGDMAGALRVKEESKSAGKSDDKYKNSLYDKADSASVLLRQANNIKASLEAGDMTFGALGEQRRALAGVVATFMPDASEAAQTLMKFDISAYDNVERASAIMLSELAKSTQGGGRMTTAALQTMAKAGPAVWQTNEGLRVATSLMEKNARFDLDKAAFADTLPQGANVRAELRQWTYDNLDDPKYNITAGELKSLESISKRSDGMKQLAKSALPHPKDVSNYINGKIYYDPQKGYAKAIKDARGNLKFKPLTFGE